MTTVKAAREMAVKAHGDQKYGKLPYVTHLDDVADIVKTFGSTAQVLAYLHDTLEDTEIDPADIEREFGPDVLKMVNLLTDPPGKNRREKKIAANRELSRIRVQDEERLVLVVKAADRLANVRRCVSEKNAGLLDMYRKEQPAFAQAVARIGLNHHMIFEIGELLKG